MEKTEISARQIACKLIRALYKQGAISDEVYKNFNRLYFQ